MPELMPSCLMAWGSSAGLVLGFAGIGFRFRVFGFIYEVWFGFEGFFGFGQGGGGGGNYCIMSFHNQGRFEE